MRTVLAQLFPRGHEFFKYPSRAVSRYLSVDFKQQRLVTLNELRCCVRLENHFLRGLTSPMSGRASGRSPLAKVRLDGPVSRHKTPPATGSLGRCTSYLHGTRSGNGYQGLRWREKK